MMPSVFELIGLLVVSYVGIHLCLQVYNKWIYGSWLPGPAHSQVQILRYNVTQKDREIEKLELENQVLNQKLTDQEQDIAKITKMLMEKRN